MSENFKIEGGENALGTVESSYDTLRFEKRENFLLNAAGVGVYAHGRIHQQSQNRIFVSDLIHKSGHLQTKDILLMEEAALLSGGEPLTIRSSFGRLVAMAMIPSMDNAQGEGDLIAYYEAGVASFDTAAAPRISKANAQGEQVVKGWDSRKLVTPLLNCISAVGRYAVAVLPRDHLFRSVFGLHFLRLALGEGTFKTEQINKRSVPVDPILEQDPPDLLRGAACGFWLHGNRMVASTGLVADDCISVNSFGRGFVSWNQASTFTEDSSPIPVWEGLWVLDNRMAGLHWFGDAGVRPGPETFGFLASDTDTQLYFATIEDHLRTDIRDGKEVPIEGSFETGRFFMGTLGATKVLRGGTFEAVFDSQTSKVRVLVRTDSNDQWSVWKEFGAKIPEAGREVLVSEDLGAPPRACTEATWFQVRVETVGWLCVKSIDLEYADGSRKSGRQGTAVSGAPEKDFFEINESPASERWQQPN